MQGHVDINFSQLFIPGTHPFTRGHHYKLYKPHSSCLPYSRPLPFDQSVIGTLCLKMSSVLLPFLSLSCFWIIIRKFLILIISSYLIYSYILLPSTYFGIVILPIVHLAIGSAAYLS